MKEKKPSSIILKITLFNHIRALVPFFIIFICTISILICMYNGKIDLSKIQINTEMIIVFSFAVFLFACSTLPALFFHIEYFIRNRKEEYEIGNKKIIRRKTGTETIYNVEDINELYLYLSPPKFRNDFLSYCAWDQYHFAKIVMKSGEVLYLTCLLYPSGLEKVLLKYVKKTYWSKKRLFPTTLYCPLTSNNDNELLDEDL